MKEQIQKLIERMHELRSQLNRNAVFDNTDNLQSEYSDDLGQVCEILEDKLNLENEIAELKESAIIPKFRIGETVWLVYTKDQISPIKVTIGYFRGDSLGGVFYSVNDDSKNYYTSAEKQLYATQEEAQTALDKLKKE